MTTMNKTFDEYWEKFISYLFNQCVRINPNFPKNKQEFKASINKLLNRIRPGVSIATVIFIYLLITPLLILIAESHIINRVTSIVISNGLIHTLLSLVFLFCLITFLVKWEQLKSFVKWDRFKSFVKDNIVPLSLILLFICFYHYWESLIGNHIISKFLCNFESNWLIDSIFILGAITCFFLSYHNRKKRINQKTLLYYLILIAFWIYYRCSQNLCGLKNNSYYLFFESLSFTNSIKYIDIVPIYAVSSLISPLIGKLMVNMSGRKKYEEHENHKEGLILDVPIVNIEDDLFNREEFAKRTIRRILATSTMKGSFTFGIDAPWGEGKTSFMYLMKNHINKDTCIVIDFNPWLYSKKTDLVSVFFNELSMRLKRYDSSLSKNIIDYSKLLTAFNTQETNLLASLIELTHNEPSLLEKKQLITDALINIQKKVVVFIDDLDRLDADELMEMMKLIRNISDFPYLYYIAAYDRSYLVECLNPIMKSKGIDFIKKVFQYEYQIPTNPSFSNLFLIFFNKDLSKKLTAVDLKNLIDYLDEDFVDSLQIPLNPRDMKRIINGISTNYNPDEINNYDDYIIVLFLFELLKSRNPQVFNTFMKNWSSLSYNAFYEDGQYLIDNTFINNITTSFDVKEKQFITKVLLEIFRKENFRKEKQFRHFMNPSVF